MKEIKNLKDRNIGKNNSLFLKNGTYYLMDWNSYFKLEKARIEDRIPGALGARNRITNGIRDQLFGKLRIDGLRFLC